jgi:hypothetical protein
MKRGDCLGPSSWQAAVISRHRDERGAVAIIVAVALVALLGLILLAVQVGDIGMVRGMLQGSADEASLAAAKQLNGTQTGLDLAHAEALAMLAGGKNFPRGANDGSDLSISGNAYQTGIWTFPDQDTPGSFAPSTDPTQVNAIKVVARKTGGQNGPVPMFLGGSFGPDSVSLARTAIAVSGSNADQLPCKPELPIAACVDNLNCDGTEMTLLTSDSTVDNACWTGYFSGASGSTISGFINECGTIPEVSVNDEIDMNNGNVVGQTYADLQQQLKDFMIAHGGDIDSAGHVVCTQPTVFLPEPVLECNPTCGQEPGTTPYDVNHDGIIDNKDCGMPREMPLTDSSTCTENPACNQTHAVTGFTLMVITQVTTAGDKDPITGKPLNVKMVKGIPICGVTQPGTRPGPGPTCDPSLPNNCSDTPILVNSVLQ